MKWNKKIVGTIILVIALFFTSIAINHDSLFTFKRTEYKIPSNITYAMWGLTPEEFFKSENFYFGLYDDTEDFRKRAKIDQDGNLILRLTADQQAVWTSYAYTSVEDAEEASINVANDFSGFTICCYSEDLSNIIGKFPFYLVFDLATLQLLAGKDPATITVDCVVKDAGTEKVIYSATWPEEKIHLQFDAQDFSPKP